MQSNLERILVYTLPTLLRVNVTSKVIFMIKFFQMQREREREHRVLKTIVAESEFSNWYAEAPLRTAKTYPRGALLNAHKDCSNNEKKKLREQHI